jgi:hypothetical protein
MFMVALALTAAGSSLYHLAPDSARLVWDPLPIALACAGLLAGVRAETRSRINRWFWACSLAIAGALSVGWWHFTEQLEHRDLRFYLLLQGLPLLLIPLWHAIYHSPREQRVAFGSAAVLYGVAKATELNDHAVFFALEWISSHLASTSFTVRRLFSFTASELNLTTRSNTHAYTAAQYTAVSHSQVCHSLRYHGSHGIAMGMRYTTAADL